jgi:hypothetical protein
VQLPDEVLSFQVPYCTRVEPDQDHLISDRMLEQIGDSLEQLSEGIQPWHRQFRNDYFSDLGFFLAGLLLGRLAAVREKFFIVKEILEAGDGTRLHRVLDRLPDPFRFPGNGSEPRRTL